MKRVKRFALFLLASLFFFISCFDYIADISLKYPRNNPNDEKSSSYNSTSTTLGSQTTTTVIGTTTTTININISTVQYRDMVSISGGTYTQTDGSTSFSHKITSFHIAKYEVTYELWYIVRQWVLSNGYNFANAGREGHDGVDGASPTSTKYEPVTNVNWRDSMVWCNAYSEMTGLTPCYINLSLIIKDSRDSNSTVCDNAVCLWNEDGFRLPTEGEWQYVASNKGSTPYNYASGATENYLNANATGAVGWYSSNSGNSTKTVGTKMANAFDIYDMSGNVWEWCWDWYGSYSTSTEIDSKGALSGTGRILRGGAWNCGSILVRVGARNNYNPKDEFNVYGFRVVRSDLGSGGTTTTTDSTTTTSNSTTTYSSTSTTTTTTTTTTIKLWVKSYNSLETHECMSDLKQSIDGGYIMVGISSDDKYGDNSKSLIVKYDPNGNVNWKKTVAVTDYYKTVGKSIIQKSDGSYLVSCAAYDGDYYNGNNYILLIELDSSGNVNWKKTYKFTDTYTFSESLYHGRMIKTADNNYALYGSTSGSTSVSFIIKVDGNGNLLAQKVYKSVDSNRIDVINNKRDGGLIAAGIKSSSVYSGGGIPPVVTYKYWVINLKSDLSIQWDDEFVVGSTVVKVVSVIETPNSNIIMIGDIASGSSFNDVVVLKLDSNGGKVWAKKIGDDMYNIPYNAYVNSDDDMIIVGENHFEVGSNNKNGLVLSINRYGNINYQRCYYYDWYDMFNNIIRLNDGSYLIGGEHAAAFDGIRDLWMAHVNSECNIPLSEFVYSSVLSSNYYSLDLANSSTTVNDALITISDSLLLSIESLNLQEVTIY